MHSMITDLILVVGMSATLLSVLVGLALVLAVSAIHRRAQQGMNNERVKYNHAMLADKINFRTPGDSR